MKNQNKKSKRIKPNINKIPQKNTKKTPTNTFFALSLGATNPTKNQSHSREHSKKPDDFFIIFFFWGGGRFFVCFQFQYGFLGFFCVFSRKPPSAPRHLGNEINQQRVDSVTESFLELVQQNVPNLPPGAVNAGSLREPPGTPGSGVKGCWVGIGESYLETQWLTDLDLFWCVFPSKKDEAQKGEDFFW